MPTIETVARAYRARAKALRQQLRELSASLTEDRQLFIVRQVAEYEALADELEASTEKRTMTDAERIEAAANAIHPSSFGENIVGFLTPAAIGEAQQYARDTAERGIRAAFPELFSDPEGK